MKSIIGCIINGIIDSGIVFLSGVQSNSPEFWGLFGLCCLMAINSAMTIGDE